MLHATEAVPRLILLLRHKTTRVEAALALRLLGAVEAIPQLVKMLDAKDRDACAAAGEALTKFRATDVIGRLSSWLASEDVVRRSNAAQVIALLRSPEGVPYLLPLLNDPDLGVKREAVKGLTAAHSVPLENLLPLLDDEDPFVRLTVAGAVAKVNPDAAASSLIFLLKKSDSPDGLTWRYRAVEELARIRVDVLVERLVPLLDDHDDFVRLMSAEILGAAGATGAIPALQRVLERDGDPVGRRGAAFALGAMGVRAAAPYLVPLLHDKQPGPRLAAAQSLSALGSEYVYCLFPLLQDPEPQVRQAVEEIWSTKTTEEDLELLQPLLNDKDPERQRRAFKLTGTIGRRLNLPKDDPRMRVPG
jgi:HEAT repeat protein